MTASPGFACAPPICRPASAKPTPEVEMKMPSALPFSATFVSPAIMDTPASAAASCMDCAMRSRSANEKPSSRMNDAVRYLTCPPDMATSLTVPDTAKRPISPPGKKMGLTMCPSVESYHPHIFSLKGQSREVIFLVENFVAANAAERYPLSMPWSCCRRCRGS